MKNVSESLAGRITILELAGLSLREIQQDSFDKPFIPTEEYLHEREQNYRPCENIWEIIHHDGYPALTRALKTPKMYFRDTGLVYFLTKYQTVEIKMSANPKLSMTNAFDVIDRIPGKREEPVSSSVCMTHRSG